MIELKVELDARSYPIYIGSKILKNESLIAQHLVGNQVCIVTNEVVAPLHLQKVVDLLPAGIQVDVLPITDGEQYKTLATYEQVMDFLMSNNHNRSTTIVALGGGVVGDIAGFAAATFQRGVGFIQVPTTLLAQVDSSVGGKTAVNHALGKNMIGAFHQPRCVVADLSVLDTLSEAEYVAGLAEVVKYGVIADEKFFTWMEENVSALANREFQVLSHAVARSCEIKAEVVAADEFESGQRALLNFGHTFGHAYEALCGYGQIRHGEAVAMGMVAAVNYSVRCGQLGKNNLDRLRELLRSLGLPVSAPQLPPEDVRRVMGGDKKVINSKLRLVTLQRMGSAVVSDDIDEDALSSTLRLGRG